MIHYQLNFASFFLRAVLIAIGIGWAIIPQSSRADTLFSDDLIVQGSACVGPSCVNNEPFGSPTITLKLKGGDLGIDFDDTSSSGSLASNDWQITINESGIGGTNKFSIEDGTSGRTPFTLLAGAPSHALFIDSNGRVGFRTSTPTMDLHVDSSNTPTLRLDQNAGSGFDAQMWDIAGNDTSFFIRDVTASSSVPFSIHTGAPTNSFNINANGDVGIGTTTATAKLTIHGDINDSTIHLTQSGAVAKTWEIKNNAVTGRLTFGTLGSIAAPMKFAANAVDNLFRVGILATDTVDIKGNLVVLGTITPDYVFAPEYALEPIKEHAQFMWREKHLPAVGPGQVDEKGETVINVGARSQGMLEELEKAHIYIEQLHDALGQLTADKQQLASDFNRFKEDFEARLQRLEASQRADSGVR